MIVEELIDRFHRRDRNALSRLLSLAARGECLKEILAATMTGGAGQVESRHQHRDGDECNLSADDAPASPAQYPVSRSQASESLATSPHPGLLSSIVVAVTGAGGVGKSTLIGRLVDALRGRGLAVAVLACDPQSPLTGGALLGDRFRMSAAADGDDVFVRSLSTHGGGQAVADHLDVMAGLLSHWGFDVILLETAGAGQGDTAVRELCDAVVLLVQPESGDDLQWEKAGLLEVADVVVVNKADLPGAELTEAQLRRELHLPGCREVPIIRTSANRRAGIDELWAAIESLPKRSAGAALQISQRRLLRIAQQRLGDLFDESSPAAAALADRWHRGELDDAAAADALLQLLAGSASAGACQRGRE